MLGSASLHPTYFGDVSGNQGKTWLCLDESGFEATAQWPYVCAERGKSVLGYRSGHTRPRTSLLAARVDGRLVAPWLFPGTCTTTLFNTWLEHHLCPLLDELIPNPTCLPPVSAGEETLPLRFAGLGIGVIRLGFGMRRSLAR